MMPVKALVGALRVPGPVERGRCGTFIEQARRAQLGRCAAEEIAENGYAAASIVAFLAEQPVEVRVRARPDFDAAGYARELVTTFDLAIRVQPSEKSRP